MTGTGEKYAMFGQENQRSAMRSCSSGVHTLTSTINASTPASAIRARVRAQFCNRPSVFMTSQVAPCSR